MFCRSRQSKGYILVAAFALVCGLPTPGLAETRTIISAPAPAVAVSTIATPSVNGAPAYAVPTTAVSTHAAPTPYNTQTPRAVPTALPTALPTTLAAPIASTAPTATAPAASPSQAIATMSSGIDSSDMEFHELGGATDPAYFGTSDEGAPCNAPNGNACSLSTQCQIACGSILGCGCHYFKPGLFELYGKCKCGVYIPKK